MPGQRIAALDAAEDEIRVFMCQFFAGWAIAHPYEAGFGPDLLQASEGSHRQAKVLSAAMRPT